MILAKTKRKKVNIEQMIDDFAREGMLENFLLIVPTNRRVRKLKKRLIDLTPAKGASVINLETLDTFSSKVLSEFEIFSRLTESAASVFLEQATEGVKLSYFSTHNGKIPYGTIEELREVISEFKRYGILPENLLAFENDISDAEKRKISDISKIYSGYLNATLTVNALETGDIYRRLLSYKDEEFQEVFPLLYPEVRTVIVDGFDEFTPPEIEILSLLSKLKDVEIFINFDFYKFNPLIFSHLQEPYEALKTKGFEEVEDVSPFVSNAFINGVRQKLFKQNTGARIFAENIYLLEGKNREDEIALIAKQIKEILTSGNVKPSEICVAFNSLNNYSHIVRDVFQAYGIPFNLTDRIHLDRTLPVNGIINLLEILETDYYYKSILRAFGGGFVNIPGINAGNIQLAARSLKITVGLNNWKTQLRSKINEEGETEKRVFSSALESIEKIEKILAPFARRQTIKEFIGGLISLINSLGIKELLFRGNDSRQEINIKSVSVFLEALKEVFELIELKEGKEKKFDLSFFLDRLRTIARSTRFNVKERPDFGVLVTSVNEIRGLVFDFLFLGGMIDGDFPTKYSPEIFKPSSFAKNEVRHLTEQRYLFYQALKAWRKKLFFTLPKYELKKEFERSNFLTEFEEQFEIENVNLDKFDDAYYSEDELTEDFHLLIKEGKDELISENKFKIKKENLVQILNIDESKLKKAEDSAEYFGELILDSLESGGKEKFNERIGELSKDGFSATQLETYAKCPFKFFLERILKVEIIEEPKEEVEPKELGSLIHGILAEFYSQIVKEGKVLSNCNQEAFDEAEKLIFQIAEKEIKKSEIFQSELSFLEREKIFGIAGNRKESILYKFLETERKDNNGFVPKRFEYPFQNVEIGKVSIRGKIDRIEINENSKLFNVVDYKLGGKKPNPKEINEGISLQLPLYLYAVSKLLDKDYVGAQMVIYSLKFKENSFGREIVNDRKNARKKIDRENFIRLNDELFKNLTEKVNYYAEGISQGVFPLSNLKDRENTVCKYCDYSSICRVTEEESVLKK